MTAAGRGRAVAAVVFMSVLFGASFPATKIALEGFSPSQLIFLRFVLASLVFLALSPWTGLGGMDRRGALQVLVLALFEPGAYFFLEAWGIQRTLASTAAVLIATIPVFVMVLEAVWLKVPVSAREVALIVLSLGGIALLVGASGFGEALGGSLSGNLLILGAALAASMYTAMARRLVVAYSPIAVTRLQAFYAVAMYWPFAAWDWLQHKGPPPETKSVLALAYLGIGCSFLAYVLLNYSLSRLKASTVAAFTNVIPVVATALAILLLGETLLAGQLLGGIVVIASVTLLTLESGRAGGKGERPSGVGRGEAVPPIPPGA
ncbi:MAG: DMT family transporter [Acidobacteriota bacterium]